MNEEIRRKIEDLKAEISALKKKIEHLEFLLFLYVENIEKQLQKELELEE